jgi:hypothetical protein
LPARAAWNLSPRPRARPPVHSSKWRAQYSGGAPNAPLDKLRDERYVTNEAFDLHVTLEGRAGTYRLELSGEDRMLTRYLKPELLIVDDMGMKQLPKRSGEFLFEVIMRRHELRSTVMTSNRPIEDWGKLLGDVPAATAILDRFLQHAEIVTITGKSYRLKDKATCGKTAKKG